MTFDLTLKYGSVERNRIVGLCFTYKTRWFYGCSTWLSPSVTANNYAFHQGDVALTSNSFCIKEQTKMSAGAKRW